MPAKNCFLPDEPDLLPGSVGEVMYDQIVQSYMPTVAVYLGLILQDRNEAFRLAREAFNNLFRPIIRGEELKTFESRVYKEASLLAMEFRYGKYQKEAMYAAREKELELLMIEAFIIEGIAREPERYAKLLKKGRNSA